MVHRTTRPASAPIGHPSVDSASPRLADIRKVILHFIGGTSSVHFVLASEVDTFVEASKRLHWKPGRNPHNNAECAKVWQITVAQMEMRGPFWWSVPDLQNNGDPKGARIIDAGIDRPVFQDAEQIARWRAEEAEEEAEHYRAQERRAKAAASSADT